MENMETDASDNLDFEDSGRAMHSLAARLFPICRSLTGDGVRETLRILQEHVPLEIREVPSGTRVFDWVIPKEWNVRDAYVLDPRGEKIIDFKKSNLHVLGYSAPVDATVSLGELQTHLYSLENLPDAIPYVTSYYEERWGFCLPHSQRTGLVEGDYRVVIDSDLKDGHLTYGELRIAGESEHEILLSTNICHPSLANNELSGPIVTTWLAKWLVSAPRRYSYRIVFIPETIGSLTYMSRHLTELKERVVAGFNVVCVGDDRAYSYLPSRRGDSLADRAALAVLRQEHPDFLTYPFLERGSDERQYCSPGADLPVASVMRTMYRKYPEYHTSFDDLTVVTPSGLQGGFDALRACLELLERNRIYKTTTVGEPQLGRRGLFPTLGTRDWNARLRATIDLLAYADGTRDLMALAETIDVPVRDLYALVDVLCETGLLEAV